jgi:hypothetical protein
MKTRRWAALGALALGAFVLALAPSGARAYSFGSFAPGEQILSIQVGSGAPATPSVVYDDTTLTLTFSAPVSTITTNVTTYNIPLGDVWFDSSVMLSTQTILPPAGFPVTTFNGTIAANFVNGITADLTITDLALGPTLLLAAEYDAGLDLGITKVGAAPVSGSLGGSPSGGVFTLSGGDSGFVFAFGPAGVYHANLASFTSDGSAVATLCHLIKNMTSSCPRSSLAIAASGELDDFTVNPVATITRTTELVPEPAGLLLAGLVSLLAWSWRRI